MRRSEQGERGNRENGERIVRMAEVERNVSEFKIDLVKCRNSSKQEFEYHDKY